MTSTAWKQKKTEVKQFGDKLQQSNRSLMLDSSSKKKIMASKSNDFNLIGN